MKRTSPLLVILAFFSFCKEDIEREAPILEKTEPKIVYNYGYKFNDYKVTQDTIRSGESFSVILDRHHVFYQKVNQIINSTKSVFDFRKVKYGKTYTILSSKDSIEKAQVFIYKHDRINSTIIDFRDSIIKAVHHKKRIKKVLKTVEGTINTNFSEAMDSLHLFPNLTWKIADIYAWTLDFYKLQKRDYFKFTYEEKFIEDTIFIGYGELKSAVFRHKGEKLYAFNYTSDSINKAKEFYDEKGNMLRSQFLKSPIKFQYRISSHYNLRRRIPYYGNRVIPHRGTDFAAAVGTPIISTANGIVVESARKRSNGNYVKIKHNNIYSTKYLHMKKRNVNVGEYVKQGSVIGWVGMTGNTDGPHVCYRFWKNNKEVDPFKQKLPHSVPLKENIKNKYLKYIRLSKYVLDNKLPVITESKIIKSST